MIKLFIGDLGEVRLNVITVHFVPKSEELQLYFPPLVRFS